MQQNLAIIRQQLATQAGILNDLDSLIATHNSMDKQRNGSAYVEAITNVEYITGQIQSVLDQGNPLLNAFRDKALGKFIGLFSAIFNGNVSYFVPHDIDKVTLVKTRVKSAESMLRKLATGKTMFDEFGATLVAKTWDDVNNDVRPWLEDNFHVIPGLGKFYVDGMDVPTGYDVSSVMGKKSTGYQGQHLVVLYPVAGIQQSIPIDIHLYDQQSFLDNEFGNASLSRHLSQDLNTAIQLMSLMGFNEGNLYGLFSGKTDAKTIVCPSGKVWYIGDGYKTKADQCREAVLERDLPRMYAGVKRFMGKDGLKGYPSLESEEARAIVDSVIEKYPSLQEPGKVNGEVSNVLSKSFMKLSYVAEYSRSRGISKTPNEISSELQSLQQDEARERQKMVAMLN